MEVGHWGVDRNIGNVYGLPHVFYKRLWNLEDVSCCRKQVKAKMLLISSLL